MKLASNYFLDVFSEQRIFCPAHLLNNRLYEDYHSIHFMLVTNGRKICLYICLYNKLVY